MYRIKENIHHQLVGNPDYINSNIVLNGSADKFILNPSSEESEKERKKNNVYIYIFPEAKPIELKIHAKN